MKVKPTYILLVDDNHCRLIDGAGAELAAGAAIEATLAGFAPRGTVTLAAPSHWCLCATIDAANLPRARRGAMVFRLEEKLPLSAEDVVADFIDAGPTALGVAGQLRHLQPAATAVRAAGWTLESVAPAALLAVQHYLGSGKLPPCDVLLFPHDGQVEVVQLADQTVCSWDTLPATADDLVMDLGVRAMNGPLRVACAGLDREMVSRLGAVAEVTEVALAPATEAAARTAVQVSKAGHTPLVELRRDALGSADTLRGARRSVQAVVAAGVVLAIAVGAAIAWRAWSYQRLAAGFEQQQREVFETTFPRKPLRDDLSVATQLLREERRLRGLSGGEANDLPVRGSTLALLQRVLSALPADGRCRVNELRLSDDRVWIEAVVPTHADGTGIAASLAADKGFTVDPPRTEQLGGGSPAVSLTLSATAAGPGGAGR